MLHYIIVLNRYKIDLDKSERCQLYDYDVDSAFETKEQAQERIKEIYKIAKKHKKKNQKVEKDDFYNIDITTEFNSKQRTWDWYKIILR